MVPKAARASFDSAVLLACSNLWKERSRRTFDKVSRTPLELTYAIIEEASSWVTAGYTSLSPLIGTKGR
jgi:hypothetical protein